MKGIKILFTSFNREGTGSYLRALALAKELAQLAHDVTILCASCDNHFEVKRTDELNIICFPWGRRFLHGYNIREVLARKRWLGSQHFDLVHAFDMRPTCAYPAFQARQHGAVMVTDWADWFGKGGSVEERSNPLLRAMLSPLETFAEKTLRKKTDATTVICNLLYKKGLDLGIPKDKLLLLYNGFNQKSLQTVEQSQARQKLGLAQDVKIMGSLGAFFAKDFLLLKQAIPLLPPEPPIQYLHIGQGNPELQQSGLHQTGHVSDEVLSLYLKAIDLLVLPMADIPANHGRFPLKFSDYLSAGKPILVTHVGDIPTFIKAYNCGFVCAPEASALAKTMHEALLNPIALQRLSANALALSENEAHSWHARALALQNFYQQILSRSIHA